MNAALALYGRHMAAGAARPSDGSPAPTPPGFSLARSGFAPARAKASGVTVGRFFLRQFSDTAVTQKIEPVTPKLKL